MKRKPMMKPLLLGLVLLGATLLSTSCSQEINEPGGGKDIAVSFLAPQVSTEVEVGNANSGASTRGVVALPSNTTVRVVAFANRTAEANPSPKNYVAEQTYYVKSGVLTPCTVNEDGTFKAEVNTVFALPSGVYTFYTISPALPHKTEDNTVVVANGVDYSVSETSGINVNYSMKAVSLTSLAHQCVRVKLKVTAAGGSGITTLSLTPSGRGVTISGLQPAVTAKLGTTVFPVVNGEETTSVAASTFTETNATTSQSDKGYILPAASGRINLFYDLTYTDANGKGTRTFEVVLAPGTNLTPGNSYLVSLAVDKAIRTVTVTPELWTDNSQDVGMGTPPASYVEGGKYIITSNIYGSTTLSHEIWLAGTPSHKDNEDANNSMPHKLQVANTDVNSGTTLTLANAITACTAYAEEGGGWRVPTKKEAYEVFSRNAELSAITRPVANATYWTSTQTTNSAHSYGYWYVNSTNLSGYDDGPLNDGAIKYCTRCVRDIGSRDPSTYPYVLDGKYIVSRDAEGTVAGKLHSNWTSTPEHTDASGNGTDVNTVSTKFEVASSDTDSRAVWSTAITKCTSPWRVPTLAEMRLMLKLNDQLTNKLTANWCWTATMASETKAWGIDFVYSETYSYGKSNSTGFIRCVKDI